MSIFDEAQAVILVADYISVDAAGKISAIGAGFAIAGIAPNGLTAPQHIAAMIDVPSRHVGQEFALSLELRNETTGTVVQLPGLSGQLEALRVQQVCRVELPRIPGAHLPVSGGPWARVQAVIGFPTGLPLQAGNLYAWRLEIDGQTRADWSARFYIPGAAPQPVFGGPAGPADIPPIPPPPTSPV